MDDLLLADDENHLFGFSEERGVAEEESGSEGLPLPTSGSSAALDYDLSPQQVVERIERCALWLVEQLAQGRLPDLQLDSFPPPGVAAGGSQAPAPAQTRSLLGRHPESADRYARLWALLQACHESLTAGARATQRELHYRLKPMDVFTAPCHTSDAVQDAVALLRVPRSSLGITCSSKGLVAGRLRLRDRRTGAEVECWGPGTEGGRPIGGDLDAISYLDFSIQATVLAVLVVEKDAVFQQLVAAADVHLMPACILVTGKGVPDVATRAFLAALHAARPALVLLGLVDWNPSGVGILSLYRHGSRRMAESARYRLPALRWLGARSGMLRGAAGEAFQELTPRDRTLITNLGASLRASDPGWAAELDAMEAAGVKAEMEAAYTACGGASRFSALLADHVRRGDWI